MPIPSYNKVENSFQESNRHPASMWRHQSFETWRSVCQPLRDPWLNYCLQANALSDQCLPNSTLVLCKSASVNRTDQIKSRMGGFIQTAFWEVRSEPFGS